MRTEIRFTVPGTPVGKGRPRFVRATGRTYTPDKTRAYEKLVYECWKAGNFPKLYGPLTVHISARFPIPQSWSKKKKALADSGMMPHDKRPDIDNCIKSLFDGLQGYAFDDDSQITNLTCEKYYDAEPRVIVVISGDLESDGANSPK